MMPIAITVILAVYGWAVIARIAKYRAASDLYNSAILLLEQLESDGEKAWSDNPNALDEYTERKLSSKIASFEQRIYLIQKFYNKHEDDNSRIKENIHVLHKYLTADMRSEPHIEYEYRKRENQLIISEMTYSLLESSHEYINKNPLLPWLQ